MTQADLQELFTLDAEKGELYWKVSLSDRVKPGALAGRLQKSRWVIGINKKEYFRSRLIFLLVNGWLPREVDHENRNKADDRPSNLRPATTSQNGGNRVKRKDNTTGFKGVFYCPKINKIHPFVAEIRVNWKKHSLGYFSTPEEAYIMYCLAALFYFGEFACG
jgi:hypothetical protein